MSDDRSGLIERDATGGPRSPRGRESRSAPGDRRRGARPAGRTATGHLEGHVVPAGRLLLSPSTRSSLVGVELLSCGSEGRARLPVRLVAHS